MSNPRAYKATLIEEASLASAVRNLARFGRVRYSPVVDSTNARALEVLSYIDSLGISFVTESQELGRGRSGRSWFCPPGAGVLISTILPAEIPNGALAATGFWAALAVGAAVREFCGIELQHKWPNDLLLGGLKCAGILCEGRSSGNRARVVVGVGINANRPQAAAPEISGGAAWLSDALGSAVDRAALIGALLRNYEHGFDILASRPQDVIRHWADRADVEGKRLVVKSQDGAIAYEGTGRGVTADGALLLETQSGTLTVTLGDVDVLAGR